MNILVLGGTGLIGSKLVAALTEEKYHVYVLTRSQKESTHPFTHYVQYSPENPNDISWHKELPDDIEMIYNLAGASLNQRWTKEAKESIFNSRIDVMKTLERFVENNTPPSVLVNASAIGYYPTSEHLTFDESDEFSPVNFLQQVVTAWENRARRFESFNIRVVRARIGLVLAREGGALPLISLPYKLGVGGPIGNGQQWYSWIHVDDLVNAFLYVGANKAVSGPVNMTAPTPQRQAQFGAYLSAELRRPNCFRTPKFLIDMVLGERSLLVVKGQKVMPKALLSHHFKYLYSTLDLAFNDLYGE